MVELEHPMPPLNTTCAKWNNQLSLELNTINHPSPIQRTPNGKMIK